MDFNEIIKSHPFVLVDFYADWCEPCKWLDEILQEVANHFGDRIKIVKINTEKNKEIAEALTIKSVPTLLLFKEGIQIWRYKGFMNIQDTIKLLEGYHYSKEDI